MTILKQPLSKLRAKSVSGPRVLIVVASVATILITLVEMFRGALTVGIGWDEPIHRGAFEEFMAGEWSPDSYWGLAPGGQGFIYGNAFQWMAHLANVARGNEAWGVVTLSAESYAVRHLVLVLLFVMTLLAVAAITYIITTSGLVSLVTAALLAAIPVFTGHAIHNPKDIPVACGYTLLTLGCVSALGGTRGSTRLSNLRLWVCFAAVTGGIWLAVGTRFALWLPFALTAILTAVISFYFQSRSVAREGVRATKFNWISPLLGTAVGLTLVVLSHPHYAQYPTTWITKSIRESANFAWFDGGTLTGGVVLAGQSLPWFYLPSWVVVSIPLGLLVMGVAGIIVAIAQLLSRQVPKDPKAMVVLVLIQALALPLTAIFVGSIMYNAQRQHLYMYPALAVIGALGVWWALTKAETSSSKAWRLWGAWGVAGFVAVSLIYPTIERQRLFPYEYAYLNELATINGVNGRWETDYWATSFREALTRVPLGAELKAIGPQDTFYTYPHLQGTDVRTNEVAGPGEYWQIQITNGGMKLPENCRDVDSVTRNFRGENVVMSWVGICKD